MTTFAPTFTPRWRGTYICAGVQHTLTLRKPRGTSDAAMDFLNLTAAAVFDAVHGDLCEDYQWVSAEICHQDEDVFFPATTPTVTTPGGNSLSDYSPRDKVMAMTLSGKSSAGRARISIYGLLFRGDTPGDIGADGLVKNSELAGLATIRSILQAAVCGSDGTSVVYRTVATWKENDHLLKLVRKGIIS